MRHLASHRLAADSLRNAAVLLRELVECGPHSVCVWGVKTGAMLYMRTSPQDVARQRRPLTSAGFDVAAARAYGAPLAPGVVAMARQVNRLRGRLDIRSAAGAGTTIHAVFPARSTAVQSVKTHAERIH